MGYDSTRMPDGSDVNDKPKYGMSERRAKQKGSQLIIGWFDGGLFDISLFEFVCDMLGQLWYIKMIW